MADIKLTLVKAHFYMILKWKAGNENRSIHDVLDEHSQELFDFANICLYHKDDPDAFLADFINDEVMNENGGTGNIL